jgi:hypothetical protein
MSNCFSENDINWPSKGPSKSIVGPNRPAIARVWHGMLLVAQANFKPGQSGPIQGFIWDPYLGANSGSAFLSPVPIQMGTSVAAPAILYADLVLWLFYSDGTDFVCAPAPQPALNASNNQIQFTSFKLGTPTVVAAGTTATNPSVMLFNGNVYAFWTDNLGPSYCRNIFCAVAPYTPGGNLAFGSVETLSFPISQLPMSEPSFAVWQGSLYCAFRGVSNDSAPNPIEVFTLTPGATGLSVNSVPNQWNQNCGTMQCNYAPAIAADPKGTFLTIVFCQPGSDQLCTTYLVSRTTQWAPPQLISGQKTCVTPSLITTESNYAYVAYLLDNKSGTNIVTSGYLPAPYA